MNHMNSIIQNYKKTLQGGSSAPEEEVNVQVTLVRSIGEIPHKGICPSRAAG